jgi:phosphoglycolate phosphatase
VPLQGSRFRDDATVAVALFDLDGTLIDPKVGITRSVQYALGRLGIVVDDADTLVAYIGPPLQDSFVSIAGLSPADALIAVDAYREWFTDAGIFESTVYTGVESSLRQLKSDGWTMAVATSKPTVFAERILEHFELRWAFDRVAGAALDGSTRHKAEIVRCALEATGADRAQACVMIGDREHDVAGAKANCISSVGVTWGYGSARELSDAGADVLVHRVPDLRDALTRLIAAA